MAEFSKFASLPISPFNAALIFFQIVLASVRIWLGNRNRTV